MNTPEIRIKYSKLLDNHFASLFAYKKAQGLVRADAEYPDASNTTAKIPDFQSLWDSKKEVLGFMQETLGLQFYKPVIEVFVVGNMKGGISSPIVIDGKYETERFVDALIHELAHDLISDNKQQIAISQILPAITPNEPPLTVSHVVIYALLVKIYTEFFQDPSRLVIQREVDASSPEYTRAWELVDAQGADNILVKFKSFYQ